MDIVTERQVSELWGITSRRVSEMCRQGKIEGAIKVSAAWVMPADTEKPKDERVTTGRWIGYKRKKVEDKRREAIK
ncbi:MAG: DNA-binding protein [Clostridia bacterium]|nr:DNA-binding protein [Clostridia bacterium]